MTAILPQVPETRYRSMSFLASGLKIFREVTPGSARGNNWRSVKLAEEKHLPLAFAQP